MYSVLYMTNMQTFPCQLTYIAETKRNEDPYRFIDIAGT